MGLDWDWARGKKSISARSRKRPQTATRPAGNVISSRVNFCVDFTDHFRVIFARSVSTLAALFILGMSSGDASASSGCISLLKNVNEQASVAPASAHGAKPFETLAAMVSDFKDFTVRQYGAGQVSIYEDFGKLGPGFERLIVDPALVQRRGRFFRFLAEKPKFANAWKARNAFRESTRDVTVYRAIALSDEELEVVGRLGIESSLTRGARRSRGNPFYELNTETTYTDLIKRHLSGWTHFSPFVSVSEYPEVAVGVAGQVEGKVHLFRITVKEADLTLIGPKNRIWSPADYGKKRIVLLNGKSEVNVPADDRMESIIFFGVPPSSFQEIPFPAGMNYRFED